MNPTAPRITCTAVREQHPPLPRRRHGDDPSALVQRAATGDERAWQLLIGRFDATIKSVARRHGLNEADRDEVAQRTWLAFVRHVDRLGDHPAIAGWLVTTARRECLKVIESHRRERPSEDPLEGREPVGDPVEEQILAAERATALHRALEAVPSHEQRLLHLLLREPDFSYDEISATLGIPKGSIGPTRGRCLTRLRDDRHLTAVVRGSHPTVGHDLI